MGTWIEDHAYRGSVARATAFSWPLATAIPARPGNRLGTLPSTSISKASSSCSLSARYIAVVATEADADSTSLRPSLRQLASVNDVDKTTAIYLRNISEGAPQTIRPLTIDVGFQRGKSILVRLSYVDQNVVAQRARNKRIVISTRQGETALYDLAENDDVGVELASL